MGEVRVPKAAKWQAQTQRAVENFPIIGHHRRAVVDLGAGRHQGCRRIRERSPQDGGPRRWQPPSIRRPRRWPPAAGTRSFPSTSTRPGSGTSTNMNMNEVLATLASERSGYQGAPQRRRQRLAVVQRRVPVGDPPGRGQPRSRSSSSPRWSIWPGPCARRAGPVQGRGQVRANPPHGRHAGDAGPGVRRVRGRRRARHRAPARGAAPGRGAASGRDRRRYRDQRAEGVRPGRDQATWPRNGACPCGRLAIISRPRAPATPWWRRRGCCGPSPYRSTSAPPTCAGWAAGPGPGWPRSASRTCSPDRRSCRARSTRSSPRRCHRSWPR